MLALQSRQRARRSSQLRTGMLSYQRMVWPHAMQRERGDTMDSWAGRREMQTLRKLPKSRPTRNPSSSKREDEGTVEVYGSATHLLSTNNQQLTTILKSPRACADRKS